MQVSVWACRQTLTWVLCQMPQINLVPPHQFIENPHNPPPKKNTSSCFLRENMHHFFLPERSGSPDMIEQWIQLVHEKNALVSEESELMVA